VTRGLETRRGELGREAKAVSDTGKPLACQSPIPYIFAMPRPLKHPEHLQARFPTGTLASIEAVLAPDEQRPDFVRAAVTKEIDRRKLNGRRHREHFNDIANGRD
jgi:hypothetical protein